MLYWLWLAHCPINDRLKGELLRHFSDPKAVFMADRQALAGVEGMTGRAVSALQRRDLSLAEAALTRCAQSGLHVLTMADPRYPNRLMNIYDPPVVLYYKGSLPEFDVLPAVAVVGTRHPSDYGSQTARRMGYELSCCGGLVVSGLAEGVDAAAMYGALAAGKPAVGVLGCGADVVYPACNKNLFKEVAKNGCILSEFAPGTRPDRWNFPKRNRLVSGLTLGTLVVEAPEISGSLITARNALEQGRDVFVVPGNVDMPGFAGSMRLLRDGATPVSTGWDVLSEYANRYPDTLREVPDLKLPPEDIEKPISGEEKSGKNPTAEREPAKKGIDKAASPPYIDLNTILTGLSPDERAIAFAIGEKCCPVDDVIAETGVDAGKALALLTMLELKGILRRHPGKRVSLILGTSE